MATIVMTGATSGFGAIAVQRLRQSDDLRLILGSRRQASADDWFPLDLTTLDSVRTFATSVRERLADGRIDALVLNAGVIRPETASRTADGAVVVLTTSGTHDPAVGAGLTTPRHANAELLAHPDQDPDLDDVPRKAGQHAYTASKLCAILTANAFSAQRSAMADNVTVIAYDPGQVFGTGLVQDLALPLRIAWRLFATPVGWPVRRLSPTLNTQTDAGRTLADLAFGQVTAPNDDTYAALRRGRLNWTQPSELARTDGVADALWRDSARLVGMPAT